MIPASTSWHPLVGRLDDASPDAGRLARLASLAVRVEPRLLRRLRLRFLPGADASCEADVWFSALVAVRDPHAFIWAPGAAGVLRDALPDVKKVDLAQVRAEIACMHRGTPPLVQLEEELAWLVVCKAPRDEIERALGRAVRALQDQPAHADDLAAWAVHALPELPEAARRTAPAWQLGLAAASRFGITPEMGVAAPDDLLAHVVDGVLAERSHERLRIVRDAHRLWLEPAPDAKDSDPEVMTVPSTRPLWVEVSSEQGRRRIVLAIEPGQRVLLDATGGDVLRSALGDAWVIESSRVPRLGATPDADAGEVLFGWVIVRIPQGEPERWLDVRAQVLADLARSAHRAGRIDLIVVLAAGTPLEDRPLLEAIGDQLRGALGESSNAACLVVSLMLREGSGEPRVIERMLVERVHVLARSDDHSATWPAFAERVHVAMGPSPRSTPRDLVMAIGRGAARLAERRYPMTVPLVIVDDTSPWALPSPGVRLNCPAPLWSSDVEQRRASYGLGCVRRAFPPIPGSRSAGILATVERSWTEGEWRDRTARSPVFDLGYPGDRDFGWARTEVVVVIGDPGRDGFVDALRAWWDGANPEQPQSFIVFGGEDVPGQIAESTQLDEQYTRAWLFVREEAKREHAEALAGKLGTINRIGFVDRSGVIPIDSSGRMPLWIAVASDGDTGSSPPVTSAALEALLGAARHGASIRLRDLQKHLAARHPRMPEITDVPGSVRVLLAGSDREDEVAPAPKCARIDTSAMCRIFGGEEREENPIEPNQRLVFVTGRNAAARSAWIDRWLRSLTELAVNAEPRTVFGWSPWRQPHDALVTHVRSVLIEWSSPPSTIGDAREVAWRIEGTNALFVLDGLSQVATGFERRLIEACRQCRAGTLLVSTPRVADWMRGVVPEATILDLSRRLLPAELLRETDFQPTVAAWIEKLASRGHDHPVLVAIALARAAVRAAEMPEVPAGMLALGAWLVDGNPTRLDRSVPPPESLVPAERIAASAVQAALALSDGDPERMLARVRDTVELAITTLGSDLCTLELKALGDETAEDDSAPIRRRELGGDTSPLPAERSIDFTLERQRHVRFVGRDDVLTQLDEWLLGPGGARWVVVTGGPGMGKSAILSEWLARREAAGAVVPHHFIRRQVIDWDQPEAIAASLAAQIEAVAPDLRDPEARPEARLIELLSRVSNRLGPSGNLVVMIDGLDETRAEPGENPLPRFLPHIVLPGIRFLCSMRPTYPHLGWIEARSPLRRLDLDGKEWAASNEAAVRDFWKAVAPHYQPPLPAETVADAIVRADGNVLHAVMLHDTLQALPPAARRADRFPRGLRALIGEIWDRAASHPSVRVGLGLLCAAREALSLDVLSEVAQWGFEERARFIRDARQLLLEEPASWGGNAAYCPRHDWVREVMCDLLGAAAMRAHHATLSRMLATWPAPAEATARRYALRYALIHLAAADEWENTWSLAADTRFLETRCRELGVHDVEADVARVAERCRTSGDEVLGQRLGSLAQALGQEAHWLQVAPEAAAALIWNRLRQSWSVDDLDKHLRIPAEPTFLRIRYMYTREDSTGHRGRVTACAVISDGQRVVSASADGELLLWDASSGRVPATLSRVGAVRACAVTPDGRRMVSSLEDRTLKIWDLERWSLLATFEGHAGAVTACAVTPDGRRVISASEDRALKVWDLESGSLLTTFEGHAGAVSACAVTPDGRRVISASEDRALKVWDLESGRLLTTFEGHAGAVSACAVTPDGQRVVSGSEDRTLKVWHLESSRLWATLAGHADVVNACSVTPDGRRAVSASSDRTLKVWDLETHACLLTHRGDAAYTAVSATASFITAGDIDGTVQFLDWPVSGRGAEADKHTILFLVTNPEESDRLALDREAHAIQAELERTSFRDRFELVTRWASEQLDLYRYLRKLKPTVLHFTRVGDYTGRHLQSADGRASLVAAEALVEVFQRMEFRVRVIVLNGCYSELLAEALLGSIDCVVGTDDRATSEAMRSFAIGFYGGLGECESVAVAYRSGRALISLAGHSEGDYSRLKVREGVDADQLVLAAEPRARLGVRPISVGSPGPVSAGARAFKKSRTKNTIVFLAANPSGTNPLALDQELRSIQDELDRSGRRDSFDLEARWAVEPVDLLRMLYRYKPIVVHFSLYGNQDGLLFQAADRSARLASNEAIAEIFGAAGATVRVVVLNGCYNDALAEALLVHVDCVLGVDGQVADEAARCFAIGFYSALGDSESIRNAYQQGRAAISLNGSPGAERFQMRVRAGVDPGKLVLAAAPR